MKLISPERSRQDESFGIKIFKNRPIFDPFRACQKNGHFHQFLP